MIFMEQLIIQNISPLLQLIYKIYAYKINVLMIYLYVLRAQIMKFVQDVLKGKILFLIVGVMQLNFIDMMIKPAKRVQK